MGKVPTTQFDEMAFQWDHLKLILTKKKTFIIPYTLWKKSRRKLFG